MIKINSKEVIKKKLLSELLNRREPVTVAELGELINKTGRTVRNYLDEIKTEYKDYNFEIVRKANVGVYINIDEQNRVKLKNRFEEQDVDDNKEDSFSSKYRQVYILKTLFEDKFSYTMQMFADELYCSKSTIVNDLAYVQEWLEKYNLTLRRRQNQGLWIEGNEKDYRKALKDLLNEIQEKEFDKAALNESVEELDYRIDFVNYKRIKSMFPKIDLNFIQSVIQEAEKKLEFYFTDQAFLNLITHIAIAIERIKENKAVSVQEEYLESLKEEHEYKVAKWVVEELSKRFQISFPDEEIGYISMHMLGAKIQENYDAKEYSDLIENQDKDYIEIARSIIEMSSEILNVDLTEDEGLLTRLVLHLRPTIMRLKYGLNLTNPMLGKIKKDYTSIFGAAWACSSIFERKLGVSINEDEVGYIALHLALSVENVKNKIKTVVVCSSGIGTSQLVASKLTKKFGNLDITHILPFNLLNEDIVEESDLIISTIRNVKPNKKVVYVSVLVNENDLENIENAIRKLKFSSKNTLRAKNEDENNEEKENGVFERELCFLDSEITDFTIAITYYGKLLEDRGYAKEGFYKNILEREKKGSTYIGKGIAIPHANDIYVNQSKICIVRFKNPIIWKNHQLDFILILCLKFEDVNATKKFFKNFYSILKDDEIISMVKRAQSIDEVINIFTEGGHNNE